jgi:ABC-type molybdate transport system ATPase subunit
MKLSARNQLSGTVKSVSLGNVMAEVVVDVAGAEIVSVVTEPDHADRPETVTSVLQALHVASIRGLLRRFHDRVILPQHQ